MEVSGRRLAYRFPQFSSLPGHMSNNFNGSVLISLEDMKIQRAAMDHLSVVQALFKKDGDKKEDEGLTLSPNTPGRTYLHEKEIMAPRFCGTTYADVTDFLNPA